MDTTSITTITVITSTVAPHKEHSTEDTTLQRTQIPGSKYCECM